MTVSAACRPRAWVQVPGVDGVLVGPHDLSCSLGVPEDFASEVFQQVCLCRHLSVFQLVAPRRLWRLRRKAQGIRVCGIRVCGVRCVARGACVSCGVGKSCFLRHFSLGGPGLACRPRAVAQALKTIFTKARAAGVGAGIHQGPLQGCTAPCWRVRDSGGGGGWRALRVQLACVSFGDGGLQARSKTKDPPGGAVLKPALAPC